jgi:hypothetical protein
VVELATILAHAVGKLVRCDLYLFELFKTYHVCCTYIVLCFYADFTYKVLTTFISFYRMAQFHLLDPVYDETHQARLIVAGQVRS